ncbi:hypothetical protein GCM10027341_07880 [Spirosoma knui]
MAKRVLQGGHNIPSDVIERRYRRSVENLVKRYIPVCNYFAIFNNAGITAELVASGGMYLESEVLDKEIWRIILSHENSRS